MPGEKGSIRFGRIAILATSFVVLAWGAQLLAGIFVYSNTEESMAYWGGFGDAFGMVNALFSGLAFAFILVSLAMQNQDLKLQAAELSDTREVLKEQKRTLEDQFKEMRIQRMLQHTPILYVKSVRAEIVFEELERNMELGLPVRFNIECYNGSFEATAMNIRATWDVHMKEPIISGSQTRDCCMAQTKDATIAPVIRFPIEKLDAVAANWDNGIWLTICLEYYNQYDVKWRNEHSLFRISFPMIESKRWRDAIGDWPQLLQNIKKWSLEKNFAAMGTYSDRLRSIREDQSQGLSCKCTATRMHDRLSISPPDFSRAHVPNAN